MPLKATDTDTITMSLPELSALAQRAARGAGYPWGLCEEFGFASGWLAERGLDWAAPLLRRLTGPRGAGVRPASGRWISDGPVCALVAGTTLADFATLPEGGGRKGVTLDQVFDPIFLLPFVALAATRAGQAYDILLNDRLGLHVGMTGQIFDVAPSFPQKAHVALRPGTATQRPGQSLSLGAIQPVSHGIYAGLDALALRMTVPDTAISAMRAGASVSDND